MIGEKLWCSSDGFYMKEGWKGDWVGRMGCLTTKLHDTRSIGVGGICKGDDVSRHVISFFISNLVLSNDIS